MRKQSIGHKRLISQCLSKLPTEVFACPLLNYGNDKLNEDALMKIFVAAHLGKWENYKEIERNIRRSTHLRESLNLKSISGSQISRRINNLPTEHVQDLFIRVVSTLHGLTKDFKGIKDDYGILKIVDSTHLKLPPELCNWAFITKGWNVVKMHTRIVVVSEDVCYPDKIVPSTGNVNDCETSDYLIEESDATYIVDRAYPNTKNLEKWLDQGILFLGRITKSIKVVSLEEYEVNHSAIIRDSKVLISTSDIPVRLVEFTDEEGTLFRLMTTRWDLTVEQVMNLYRYRWTIETFFRWIKKHLKLVKVWSTNPQGMWNQMFLALTAYCLALIVYLETKTEMLLSEFLSSMRTFLFDKWKEFVGDVFREKSRTSKGKQKTSRTNKKEIVHKGNVAIVKLSKKKK
jgi:hypothetical protein